MTAVSHSLGRYAKHDPPLLSEQPQLAPPTSSRRCRVTPKLAKVELKVGRVKYSDPFWARMLRSIGSTAPEDCPKSTMSPRGARQSNEAEKVSLPTESYTIGTMSPLVISPTRSTTFSRL